MPTTRWYFGWNIVAAAALLTLLSSGMRLSFGPFFLPIAQDLGVGRGQFLEGGQGLLGALFLDNAQYCVENNDGHDGCRFNVVAKQGRDDRGDDEQDNHEVIELVPKHGQETRTGCFL